MQPSRLEKVAFSAIAGALMLWLGVLEWDAISPRWARWPLIALGVGGMAGAVWRTSRSNVGEQE